MCSSIERISLTDIVEGTCTLFPACKNFLKENLTTEELNATIDCVSFMMKHDTVSFMMVGTV